MDEAKLPKPTREQLLALGLESRVAYFLPKDTNSTSESAQKKRDERKRKKDAGFKRADFTVTQKETKQIRRFLKAIRTGTLPDLLKSFVTSVSEDPDVATGRPIGHRVMQLRGWRRWIIELLIESPRRQTTS